MSQIYWLNDINGSFTNPSDWSGGMVPGTSDDAILDAVGSAFTVTSGAGEIVDSVQLASNATFSITGGIFETTDGTGGGSNAGIILVGAGARLEVGGTVTNIGTIALDSEAGKKSAPELVVEGLSTTLTGGGIILLSGPKGALVTSNGNKNHFCTIDNIDNTIEGSGEIGNYATSLVNRQKGAIEANGTLALTLGGDIYNQGHIEAIGSGGLVLSAGVYNVNGAGLSCGDGSMVKLNSASSLLGGTLVSAGSGIFVVDGATIGGFGSTQLIEARLSVVGAVSLTGAVALEGGGVIEVGGGLVFGNEGTLTVTSGTISGPGIVDVENLKFGKKALVDNEASTSLTLDRGTNIVNAGMIECSGAGGVFFEGGLTNNGTLSVGGGGTLEVQGTVLGSGKATVSGGALEFLAEFNQEVAFAGGGTLTLGYSQQFHKKIAGFSAGGMTTLDLRDIDFVDAGEATFSGASSGGVLTVTDGTHTANINLKGDYIGVTFVAASDGEGGTTIIAQTNKLVSASVHNFVCNMAGLGAAAATSARVGELWEDHQVLLVSPHVHAA